MTVFAINILLLASGAPNVSVEMLDGQRLTGSLAGMDTESVTLEKSGKKTATATVGIARVVCDKPATETLSRPTVWLSLADDTRLTATSFSVKGDDAQALLTSGQPLKLARRDIRHVRLKRQDEAIASQWKEILATDSEADLLVIRKRGKIDFLEGVVRGIDAAHVQFEFDGDIIPVKLDKVEGVVYHKTTERDTPEAKAVFEMADDSRVHATVWKLNTERALDVTTPLGLKIALPAAALRRVDLTQGKLVYLGDLEPLATKWTPYIGGGDEMRLLELMFRPRSNQAIDGGPLRLGGKERRIGLSVHSRTELTYDLKGKYRSFKALAGIDDRTRERGHVEVVIKCDDKVIFSGEFAGSDDPREIDLEIKGARRFVILVDYGKGLDISDHMNFIDARFLK